MSSDGRRETTFGDLIASGVLEIGDGYRAKNAELDGDGPLFLRSGRVSDNRIDFTGNEHLPTASVPHLKAKLGQPEDTVVTTKGNSVGVTAYVPRRAPEFVYSPHLSYWRSRDASVIAPGFLRYWARAPALKSQLKAMAGSTDMAPYLSLADQKRLRIALPQAAVQRRIAGVLGALDDKIEHNSSVAEHLEAIGRAAFETAVGRLLMDGDVRQGVPADWRVVTLSELFELNPSRRLATGTLAPYLEMKNMPTVGHFPDDWYERPAGSGARFANGDTLVARITPCLENGKVAFVDFLDESVIGWGSTEYIVMRPRPPTAPSIAYFLARNDDFRDFAVRHMSGSSGRQPVSAEALSGYRVPVPDDERLSDLGRELSVVLANVRARRLESRTLSAIRDALLPKLVSGRIRVPESYDPDDVLGAVVEQAAAR
jgi:type I restriction enzyme S subunit